MKHKSEIIKWAEDQLARYKKANNPDYKDRIYFFIETALLPKLKELETTEVSCGYCDGFLRDVTLASKPNYFNLCPMCGRKLSP